MRPTAEEVVSDVAMVELVFCMLFMPSTIENDAIWAMDSFVFIGLVGSWCVSCATNSFRKPSLSSCAFGLETEPSAVPVVAAVCVVAEVEGMEVMRRERSPGQ